MDRYEEAMSRCKQWGREHTKGYVIQDMIEFIFPELAESEDERIRKGLITLVKEIAEDDDYCGTSHCEEYIAWLEKQKDNKVAPRVLQCSAAWFEDGEEKQKEQKPNIELIQRSWYMEGYHDAEFKREPKWIIKTGKGGPRHELNPRYGEPLAEQNPGDKDRYMEGYMNGMNDALKEQEQIGVDLEKEIACFALNGGTGDNTPTIGETARHFYELGRNARKED